jgi:hypothetical protein
VPPNATQFAEAHPGRTLTLTARTVIYLALMAGRVQTAPSAPIGAHRGGLCTRAGSTPRGRLVNTEIGAKCGK